MSEIVLWSWTILEHDTDMEWCAMSASDYIFLLWQVCLLLSPLGLWGGWQQSLEKITQSSRVLSIYQFTLKSNVSCVDCLEGLSTHFLVSPGRYCVDSLHISQTCPPQWPTSRARGRSLCSPRRTWACVPRSAPSNTLRPPSPSTLTTPARAATGKYTDHREIGSIVIAMSM